MSMKELNNLQNPKLKENPYSLPENYFAIVEDEVRAKIKGEDNVEYQNPIMSFISKSKTYAYLILSFGLILGLGYGAELITNKYTAGETDKLVSLIEDGYINSAFIDYMYDSISIESGISQVLTLNKELSETLEEDITIDEIFDDFENTNE